MKKTILSGLLLACMLAVGNTALAGDGYKIYPVPHSMVEQNKDCSFTNQVTVVAEKGIDEATRQRVSQILSEHGMKAVFAKKANKQQSNIFLGINGSRQTVDKLASKLGLDRSVFSKKKYDRHVLSLYPDTRGNANLIIIGEHTNAAFFGLASLEQMLDERGRDLTAVTISDYADIKDRGVIEGYYGMPYSRAVTQDLLRFMMRYKMNSYMYGAKGDVYHSQLWDKPYPQTLTPKLRSLGCFTSDDMHAVAKVSQETKVNFVWAIHPGKDFTGNDDKVIDRIMRKFELMHQLGVRQFAVFVDDVGVPYDEPTQKQNARRVAMLQNRMDQKWNRKGIAAGDTLKPLYFVPQLYAYGWTQPEKATKFYNSLRNKPAKTLMFITGRNVWSVPNNKDLEFVESGLGSDVAWWWNYPCNDNADPWIFPASMYDNFVDMPEIADNDTLPRELRNCMALLCNPMQQGEISKIALFSMGNYAWNNAAYDNRTSWLASLSAVVGKEYAETLYNLVPYLRKNDSDHLGQLISDYKTTGMSTELEKLLQGIVADCKKMEQMKNSQQESLRLFFDDIRPWVYKLKATAELCQKFIELRSGSDNQNQMAELKAEAKRLLTDKRYATTVIEGMGNDIGLKDYNVQVGSRHLTPFLNRLEQ